MGKISKAVRGVADIYNGASLIVRIIVGLIIGTVLALTMPHVTWIGEFGTLFVAALKAAAPILVFRTGGQRLAQARRNSTAVSAPCCSCTCSPRSWQRSWPC